MALFINTPQGADTTYTVTLGGVTYRFRQRWNERVGAWYLDVWTVDGELLKLGGKLLPNVPIITRNKHLMQGANLYVVKRINGYSAMVNRDNLGINQNYTLIYQTDKESENAE